MDNENPNPNIRPLDKNGLTLVWELAKAAFMNAQTASAVMQSLQSQIDSVASRDAFDELNVSVLTADIISAQNIYGVLHGNADTATKVGHTLTFGSQSYDGSAAKTITLSDLATYASGKYAISISGNADTATTAGNYTAGGGIATALGTKFDKTGGEISGDITLDADNTRSIGTSTKRLKDLYAVAMHAGSLASDGAITAGGSLQCVSTITMQSMTGTVVEERWQIASRPRGGAVTDDSYAMRVSYIGGTNPLAVMHVTRDGRVGIGNAIADAIKTGYKLNVDGNMRTAGNMDVQGGVTGYGGVAAHGISDLTTMF